MIYPPQPRLVVSGQKPPDVEVSLVPLRYVSQPQFHGIQVVRTPGAEDGPHVSQPIADVPYQVELDLEGVTGSEGVEVIGVSRTERVVVAAGATAEAPPQATQLPADSQG
jgi:hypothetical protein